MTTRDQRLQEARELADLVDAANPQEYARLCEMEMSDAEFRRRLTRMIAESMDSLPPRSRAAIRSAMPKVDQ